MIPIEILKKYEVDTIDKIMSDKEVDEGKATIIQCKTLLNKTDYEMIKAFETLFCEPENFIVNIIKLYRDYKSIITWRFYARNKLHEKEQNSSNI